MRGAARPTTGPFSQPGWAAVAVTGPAGVVAWQPATAASDTRDSKTAILANMDDLLVCCPLCPLVRTSME